MDRIWNLEKFGDNTAFIDDNNNVLTYSDVCREMDVLNEAIGGRCLIFIMCKNCIGALLGYICSLNNHIVPVMLGAGIDDDMLSELLKLYCPSFVWAPSESRRGLFGTAEKYQAFGYSLFRTNYSISFPIHKDLALLLTTSGSTGSPKFVRQSYLNIRSNTESIVEYLELNNHERAITMLPMNYTYGLSVINTHLAVGASLLVTDKGIMQKDFWSFFQEGEATSISGVPYTYEMLDKLRMYQMTIPSLRTMTQAGGKLAPELHEKFARYASDRGLRFVVMYGQCEATARMGYLPPDMALEKKGSMGIAIPGGVFRLVDDNGADIALADTTGELVYEGKNVTMGYSEKGEDLILGDERQGVLFTGDMAQRDEDGYYYIVGRKKRFLKIYGNRVNLDEMERMIKTRFEVETACTGVDDHMYIFVESDVKPDEIRIFASAKTGLNHVAFTVKTIERIPRNESGKILYKKLENYYEKRI
jgi:acyl-coenzyme A synthetase/AMP-(fatty) acid ligase